MKVETQRVRIHGHDLNRLVMHPDADVPVRAAAMFYHGQGDYAERYTAVLGSFTRRGIRCIVTDLPGHGRSPGRRGDCGDEGFLDSIIQQTLESMGDLPHGVMGHSMGGLLAARHLVLAGKGLLPEPSFSWLSSPLLRPGNGRSKAFRKWVGMLTPLMPSLTISTGVTPEMCRINNELDEEKAIAEQPKNALWHRRTSIGWGLFLLQTAEMLEAEVGNIAKATNLLLTQGSEDPVCPVQFAREFFEQLPSENKHYREIQGMLHEPFAGTGRERLFATLDQWLDEVEPRLG
ncbi:alpha/beta fold hydrolase [Verrucomicrobiaceae bacterium R5-34]|uniref:Alpha/beta fold hydrolase n=1 Tax=Oceaniferula flava TaxID=2800421 RepID=A0AAE2S949_9BACT|nr:alpha/beta fold hydrolase [Oceaniferula flavus]MBK1829737.1 alpha/beta fold hydrolase [Verrucomicrobiaceae bacterium R5-34]MBK1853923.1 alpha/beta fold hydrolase [Oceaniferula flavus]MBM1135229.1 alpha/beta fold hydrolase [Oceaniferula flavus]